MVLGLKITGYKLSGAFILWTNANDIISQIPDKIDISQAG